MVRNLNRRFYSRYIKRALDLFLSSFAIVILSPILLIIAILVRVKLGSPVLFKQKRPGLNEKTFIIYKFRTMTDEKDINGELLPDKLRLTKFGKFLRSTSLDELPELFNIIKGDMAIVGPRPQLERDIVFMTPKQRERHRVLPGLTGLAQIKGRNCISWEEKLAYDQEYIDTFSFLKDWKIILMTIIQVIKRDGINTKGMDTAEDLGDYLLRERKISKGEYSSAFEKYKKVNNK